jgi:hypothetical protein
MLVTRKWAYGSLETHVPARYGRVTWRDRQSALPSNVSCNWEESRARGMPLVCTEGISRKGVGFAWNSKGFSVQLIDSPDGSDVLPF